METKIKRNYYEELGSLGPLARFIDKHPTLANIWIIGWAAACMYIIFMHA